MTNLHSIYSMINRFRTEHPNTADVLRFWVSVNNNSLQIVRNDRVKDRTVYLGALPTDYEQLKMMIATGEPYRLEQSALEQANAEIREAANRDAADAD